MQITSPFIGAVPIVVGAILMIMDVLLTRANDFIEFSIIGWIGAVLFLLGLVLMIVRVIISIIKEARR